MKKLLFVLTTLLIANFTYAQFQHSYGEYEVYIYDDGYSGHACIVHFDGNEAICWSFQSANDCSVTLRGVKNRLERNSKHFDAWVRGNGKSDDYYSVAKYCPEKSDSYYTVYSYRTNYGYGISNRTCYMYFDKNRTRVRFEPASAFTTSSHPNSNILKRVDVFTLLPAKYRMQQQSQSDVIYE